MIIYKNTIKFLKQLSNNNFRSHYRHLTGLNLWKEEVSTEIKLKIEDHWRSKLKTEPYNETKDNKYYVLSMFPYPSGFLHMGHVRVYTISDTIARFQRMNGKNVIHPIGWDAFGLPAENAAIERQIPPNQWTEKNIEHMKQQLIKLGCSFEWDRELATCDPNYYKWTQELFLKLFESGLAYQKEAIVNWDPVDQTVLADEQVDENGCSWRSGAQVEKKPLKQWFIKTTVFAKDLLEGLDDSILQDWRDIIKLQQHWIGDCNGVSFDFKVVDENSEKTINMWTSRPEFMDASKFIAIDKSHILASYPGESLGNDSRKLRALAENPLNGEQIPIFVTDEIEYLPMTNSFLGIPGICPESAKFADKFNIPYQPLKSDLTESEIKELRQQICDKARKLNVGGFWTSAKLRDWLISRQRFWGTPIPIIHCNTCGPQPVPRDQLPVELPKTAVLSKKGGSPLAESPEWHNVNCPKCRKLAKRETDTMDTFVDSSWYYLRYLDPNNAEAMFDKNKIKKMAPVDLYIGGKEHAVLHLYYSRFISHFLHSLGMIPEREPFKRLLVQGMVMGRSYKVKETGEYLPENEVEIQDLKKNKACAKNSGKAVTIAWEKMSKSKHNGVDPDDMFREYSVDTTRLLILADVAPTSHRNWNNNTFPGILNWQKRLWLTVRDLLEYRSNPQPEISEDQFKEQDDYMFDSRNYYLKGTTFNYCGSQQHSVAISKQQGLTNSIRRAPPCIWAKSLQFERALATQIILLAPMAPHFASELWSGFVSAPNRLSNNSNEINWNLSVLEQKWPQVDDNYCLDLICEINTLEVCVVKLPKNELNKLSNEAAIDLILNQKEVQEELSSRVVLNISVVVKDDFESVVKIKTNIIDKDRLEKKKKRAQKAASY